MPGSIEIVLSKRRFIRLPAPAFAGKTNFLCNKHLPVGAVCAGAGCGLKRTRNAAWADAFDASLDCAITLSECVVEHSALSAQLLKPLQIDDDEAHLVVAYPRKLVAS